jgi:hypothetical protein
VTSTALERAGREYHEFRAALMARNNEGLTKTYKRGRKSVVRETGAGYGDGRARLDI